MDYKLLTKKLEAIIDEDIPLVSNLSNVSAILNEIENINWCGFYLVYDETLYLGPFQGEVACTTIKKGRGVCGTSLERKETIIVDDVNKFDGHIACSTKSKSEIVVPIMKNDKVVALIDIDAPIYNRFNETDKSFLEEIARLLAKLF